MDTHISTVAYIAIWETKSHSKWEKEQTSDAHLRLQQDVSEG